MIAIIDYGMGNLRSVEKAFEYMGYRAEITHDPEKIRGASHVVLPGVGAFADAMENLKKEGIQEVIYEVVREGKPFLGICLGMQLLFEKSFEGGVFEGLSIIPGEIKRIPYRPGLKVPHMGWNELHMKGEYEIFKGLKDGCYVYFVHSYYLSNVPGEYVMATTDYGFEFPVAVKKDNVYGLQFHPEKSGEVGLRILKNFVELE